MEQTNNVNGGLIVFKKQNFILSTIYELDAEMVNVRGKMRSRTRIKRKR